MAFRMTCARWQGLEEEQVLALHSELRSNRLDGSGMNKIILSRPATPYSIKRSEVHVEPCIVAMINCL
jgi:hypothetical protein